MTRRFAGFVARQLHNFATTQRYPTRTVEHAFAWLVIVWSYSVLSHNQMLSARVPGNVYGPMLDIMSADAWGWLGISISVMRLAGLIGNGHWRPSPEVRLLGAIWGMMFWIALVFCYHVAVDINGGPDFPMRRAFLVLIAFEAYSCYRCFYDIWKRGISSEPSRSMGADYG